MKRMAMDGPVRPDHEPQVAAQREASSRGPRGAAPDRGRADGALVVERVGRELAALATLADDIQRTVGAHVAAAALQDPSLMRQAQMIDVLTQTLRGLSGFLAAVERQGVGYEPLDFEAATSDVTLWDLGSRLAGRDAASPTDGIELF